MFPSHFRKHLYGKHLTFLNVAVEKKDQDLQQAHVGGIYVALF